MHEICLKNEMHKILWDLEMKADHLMQERILFILN